MSKILNVTVQLRNGTAAEWADTSVAGKGANFWKTLGFSFLGGAETNFHDDARVNFGEGFGFSYFNNKLKKTKV